MLRPLFAHDFNGDHKNFICKDETLQEGFGNNMYFESLKTKMK